MRHLRNTTIWIAVPTVLWVAVALVITDDYAASNLLLANKFLGPSDSMTAGRLWFVEVVVWILVALAAVCWLPLCDRLERQWPFGFAVGFLAFGLALRYDAFGFGLGREAWFTVFAFWYFAIGWAAAKATTVWQRAAVTVVLGVGVLGYFSNFEREALVFAGLALADLAARHPVSCRGRGRRRRGRRGVAVRVPDALPGVSAVRRAHAARCDRLGGGGRAAHPVGHGHAHADPHAQADAGQLGELLPLRDEPSCTSVAAMAPSAPIRLAVITPRPRAAAGERDSSRFH